LVGKLIDKDPKLGGVGGAVEHNAFARQSISARSTRLLIVALDIFGEIVMYHEAYVGFVDSHTERDGSDHDLRLVFDETFLSFVSFISGEPSVIRLGVYAFLDKILRDRFGARPR
jgi:hypothetical protein